MAHGPQAGHLRPHGADARVRPGDGAREGRGPGLRPRRARAFAGFLNPRNSPDAGRLDGVEGPRGAVREPVEATIAPIDEAVAHVADGSPTKLDELRRRAEQRGYGRGAALAFAGLLSPASPALLKTPGAERSWAALDEAARSPPTTRSRPPSNRRRRRRRCARRRLTVAAGGALVRRPRPVAGAPGAPRRRRDGALPAQGREGQGKR